MRLKNKIRLFAVCLGTLCAACGGAAAAVGAGYPDEVFVTAGSKLFFANDSAVWVRGGAQSTLSGGADYDGTLMLGNLPLKSVSVKVVDGKTVIASGLPFGIKLHVKGVLVVGLTDVDTAGGDLNPAENAGIRPGDTILYANGSEVTSNRQLAAIIEQSGGRPVEFVIERDGQRMTVPVTPAKSVSESKYKSGIWIRDSSLGIGTMTFVVPNGYYAGLGHAITDAQTGGVLSVGNGELTEARISGVVKGQVGTPGELIGHILPQTIGNVLRNSNEGLYGKLTQGKFLTGQAVEVAMRQEIQTGRAEILCTLEGTSPQRYEIEIEKINLNGSGEKNMVIRITDERLLQTAGGIVQGMSGSPILQNGKLVGAVTHVFINAPARGYAIFADTMIGNVNELMAQNSLRMAG